MKICLSLLVLLIAFLASNAVTAPESKPDCSAKRFKKSIVSCCGLPAFYWDGTQCVDATNLPGKCGCICTGYDGKLGSKDCDAIFDTREECEATYAGC